MCGIAGIINFKNELIKVKELQLMMNKMKHRGPDDEGVFISNSIGLGFVRLSILDLSIAGHQPMFSNDERFVIVFNGEVFNYIEIRNELKHKYTFKTETDTEVILAAFQEWGEECLDKLNGMFAFVIYDTKTKEVFGARDRFGIKPFYYFQDNDRFIFASEIKSILPLLPKKEPNNRIIYDFLVFNRTDHTNETFFLKINKIPHGSLLKIKNSKIEIYKWYSLADKLNKSQHITPKQYRELFKNSLELRLRADVPVGVTLSGGIDSSSIVASLVSDFKLNDINTFSAVFDKNDKSDESEFIEAFSSIVKNMHYVSPNSSDFFYQFEEFINTHNEPMADTSPFVQYKVMELASKHVKVTLDGQGADEQLAGYHYFFGSYYLELLKKFKLLKFIDENIKYLQKHKSINAIKYFIFYLLPVYFQNKIMNGITPSINKDFVKRYNRITNINKLLYKPKNLRESLIQHFEFKLEHMLRYEDLNSMHFSIESRVPFLDYRLVEATLSTPSYQKINKGETKYLLREALKDILPEKITLRKDKKGFTNPREIWFRSEKFKNFIFELINSERFKERGYFDSVISNAQYKKHLEGKIDLSKEIWKWINLELWFRKFIDE